MTLQEQFDAMDLVETPTAQPGYPYAMSDSNPGYNPRMVSPYPNAGGARSERQSYRSAGVPFTAIVPPIPIALGSGGAAKSTRPASTSSGGGTDSRAWLLGGNQTGIVETLGSLDANDVSGIAGGFEQWRALANGGFQVTNYFAFGGSTVQPSPPGRDTFGYVFSNFNRTLLNPVNEVRIAQNTVFVTRDSPDTNEYAIISVGLPASTVGGHVSVTNGSAAVLWVSGTKFDTNWAAGTAITINSVVYFISSVTDTTHLTLTIVYAGTTNANRAYDFTALVVDRSDRFTNGQIVQIGLENMTVNGTPAISTLVNVTRSSGTAHPASAGVFYQSGGTVVAEGLGWDIRPVNTATVFQDLDLTDSTYRGLGSGFISEIYYRAQNQTTNFSLAQFNFAAALAGMTSDNKLWQWFGYTVGQPSVSTGAKVTQPFGIFVQNLQSGKLSSDGVSDVIDDLVVAGIKMEALGNFGRIQWNGIDIQEKTFDALTVSALPTKSYLTASVSATDTNWVINLSSGDVTTNYRVGDYLQCEGEIVVITVVTAVTSTLTVTRAQRGTTAYPHYGGSSPAIQGRTITNLTNFQLGRWDGGAGSGSPTSNLYIGTADGISTGSAVKIGHTSSAGSIAVFNYASNVYQNLTIDGLVTALNSVSGGGVGLAASAASNARVQIGSGDATHAPLLLISGTLVTSPIAGALEYNGSNWWITDGTPTRAAIITTASLGTSAVTYLQGLQGGVTLTYDDSVTSATGFSISSPSGTVGTTNGSTAVTGSGFSTTWSGGAPILIGGVQYFISTVTNATNLVLTSNYLGTTGSHAYTMAVDTLHIGDASASQRGLVNVTTQTWAGDKTLTGVLTVQNIAAFTNDGVTADTFTPVYQHSTYTNPSNETCGVRAVTNRIQTSATGINFALIGGDFNVVLDNSSTRGISADQIIALRSEIYIGGNETGGGQANNQVFGFISSWGSSSFGTVFGPNARINSWWGMYVVAPPTGGGKGTINTSAYGLEIESISPNGAASLAAIKLDGTGARGRILWPSTDLSDDGAGTLTCTGNFAITGSLNLSGKTANTVFAGPTSGGAAPPAFRTMVAADFATSGTPSSTTFLRGDLSWQTPSSGAGTVTSVALATPSGLNISGSPITTSGTLTLSWTSGSPPYFSGDTPTFNGLTVNGLTSCNSGLEVTGIFSIGGNSGIGAGFQVLAGDGVTKYTLTFSGGILTNLTSP